MRDPPDSPQTETFAEFWRHYLRDHAQPGTRVLHFLGNGFGIASLLLGVITLNPMIPIVGIVIGYVLAWSGHLLIEHNRPSMVAHPMWSFICDVRMFRLWLGRRLHEAYSAIDHTGQ
jgi:hypothetical protein